MEELRTDAQRPRRPRRTRQDLRALLLQSALVEFAQHGFDGASTRSIAQRVDAHQPQINYHFESKEVLWQEVIDHLFADLAEMIEPRLEALAGLSDAEVLTEVFSQTIREFVRFAARYPELNRIMMHEATTDTPRLRWLAERHVKPLYENTRQAWEALLEAGVAAPIDPTFVMYVIVGAASLPFANAPEARLVSGEDPMDPKWVQRHEESVLAMLLPGRARIDPPDET